jgi:hypothetical protein
VYSTCYCPTVAMTIAEKVKAKVKGVFSRSKKSPDKRAAAASKDPPQTLPNHPKPSILPARSPADDELNSDPPASTPKSAENIADPPQSLPSAPNRTKPSTLPALSPADGSDPVQPPPASAPRNTENITAKDTASRNDVLKSVYNGAKQALEATIPFIELAPVPGLRSAVEGISAIIEIIEVRPLCLSHARM